MNKVHAREGNHVVMDNLFTSIPLLNELSRKGIAGTGTIRENWLENAPLPPKKSMKKTSRGTFKYACSENLVIVKWNDNTAVAVATSKVKASSCVMAERWSSAQEKKIQVPMPQPLKTYNVYMGGVDLFDQFVSQYRIRIHSKKWWWPLFSWGIGEALVNGWRLYRALEHDISLLQFTRECSQEILGKFGIPSIGHGISLVLQKNAFNQQRYDRKDHWLYKSDKQFGRCKNCGRRSIYRCEKCQVPLHPECHKTYHIVS
ncbi:PiggyBac transposable element-derived protein 3 [Araneus ventricosus]|nr:PiggyBac transposable element-derived protein 3 [Araneus ventricosus]